MFLRSLPKNPTFTLLCLFFLFFCSNSLWGQDTTKNLTLQPINIVALRPIPERLPSVEDVFVYEGKKNEVIRLKGITANLITNNARQIFSRIPGISIWENDGSGIQVSIGSRGLSPNRSWEFNTRQNGYDISSDAFGYPEAYYNPPMEAVEKIQIIRGATSLQFGPQFGGVVNYILKRANTDQPLTFETQQSIGSYGLFSSYNSIGGKIKKVNYFVYHQQRSGNGWRENSAYSIRNSHAFVSYDFSDNSSISLEYTQMDDKIQQAGGLTDAQFMTNHQQSTRARNWFGTPWNLASINYKIKFNSKLTLDLKATGLLGTRNSVGFLAKPNVEDTINLTLKNYNSRQVDHDVFLNGGIEARGLYTYSIYGKPQKMAFGGRLYRSNMLREQRGKGNSGADFNTTLAEEKYPASYTFETKNIALFAEQIIQIAKDFTVTPGIRYENIVSDVSGRSNNVNGQEILITPQNSTRNVVLTGLGLQYKFQSSNIYANVAQAYRPILYSELLPTATTDVIDPSLRDAFGLNADLGIRGNIWDLLNYDLGVFYLQYNNRIGTLRKFENDNPTRNTYQLRTNVGKSENLGVEAYVEFNLLKAATGRLHYGSLNLFASLSFIEANYLDFNTTTTTGTVPNIQLIKVNLRGKQVEYAPKQIHNIGLSYQNKNLSATAQYRYTESVYTDASNTETATADGLAGKIPAYGIFDFAITYHFLERYNLKGGVNNFTDEKYATRRANGYPGPGLIPGEGRTFFVSLGAKF